MPDAELKKTPLFDLSREMRARMAPFAGWLLPVQFASILEEHEAVRSAAGLFDVSHMGEIEVRGAGAVALLQALTCRDVARLQPGRVQYSILTTEGGAFVDDILVYRRAAEDFLLVVNAGNTAKDFAWIAARAEGDVEVLDASARWAQLAVQGPAAEAILATITPFDLGSIRYYRFAETKVGDAPALVSRTGYTGEDGFEIYLRPESAVGVARLLLSRGESRGLRPCGLGARDTLRLEAGMLLYGNDMDETTTVLEANLARLVDFEKGGFTGRAALVKQREAGVRSLLVGFEMIDPGVPRHGHVVRCDGIEAGRVTSGTFGPTVRKGIGLAYVPADRARPGARFHVVIRGRDAGAAVVPTPFHARPRRGGSA